MFHGAKRTFAPFCFWEQKFSRAKKAIILSVGMWGLVCRHGIELVLRKVKADHASD